MDVAYSSIMLTAVTVGFLISRKTQRFVSVGRFERMGIALGAVCGGIIGAKLPFVLADWPDLVSGRAWFADGKTIMFGLVGGYAGVELMKWALDIRVKTGDSFAVPVAVAVGIGRLGCFTAGCCHGTASSLPWAVDFGDGIFRHPTQLYEFAFHIGIAGVLAWLFGRKMLSGQLFKLYLVAYFGYRFATEFIRPEPKLWLDLTGYQWAALAFIPLFLGLWYHDATKMVISAARGAEDNLRPESGTAT